MKFAAWNLNHRARRKSIPSSIEAAIAGLAVDVLVFNEFVDGPGRGWFRAGLDRVGLGHQALSHTTARHNQILIAAREPIFVGDLQAPTFDGSARSNFLHVVLGSTGRRRPPQRPGCRPDRRPGVGGRPPRHLGSRAAAHLLPQTRLVRAGHDLVLVAELAGHRNLETTRRYSLPSAEDRQAAVEALNIDY